MKTMTEKQLATILECSVGTLRNHRCAGIGIPFIKICGNVRYLESDVLAVLQRSRIQTREVR